MTSTNRFREAVRGLLVQWSGNGLPSHAALLSQARELDRLRRELGGPGLWTVPGRMITATLDDGIGQGLDVIHAFSEALGIEVRALGLLKPPETIITACRKHCPDFLGLTVLQFDAEPDLTEIAKCIPKTTRLIAGGPVFKADPDLSQRSGIHFAAADVAAFLQYLLSIEAGTL